MKKILAGLVIAVVSAICIWQFYAVEPSNDLYTLMIKYYSGQKSNLAKIQQLINENEDNVINKSGGMDEWTPLIVASVQGDKALIKLLLDKGADVAKKDSIGLNAINYAEMALGSYKDDKNKETNQEEIIDMLKKKQQAQTIDNLGSALHAIAGA